MALEKMQAYAMRVVPSLILANRLTIFLPRLNQKDQRTTLAHESEQYLLLKYVQSINCQWPYRNNKEVNIDRSTQIKIYQSSWQDVGHMLLESYLLYPAIKRVISSLILSSLLAIFPPVMNGKDQRAIAWNRVAVAVNIMLMWFPLGVEGLRICNRVSPAGRCGMAA
jgi:hypothetical protein